MQMKVSLLFSLHFKNFHEVWFLSTFEIQSLVQNRSIFIYWFHFCVIESFWRVNKNGKPRILECLSSIYKCVINKSKLVFLWTRVYHGPDKEKAASLGDSVLCHFDKFKPWEVAMCSRTFHFWYLFPRLVCMIAF